MREVKEEKRRKKKRLKRKQVDVVIERKWGVCVGWCFH